MDLSLLGAAAVGLGVAALLAAPLCPGGGHVPIAHPERDALRDTGLPLTPVRWEALRVSAVAATALFALAVAAPLPVIAAGAIAPSLWLRLRLERARERARRGTTRIVRAAHAALRSGATLPDALRRGVASADDELASRPMTEALRAFAAGASLEEALLASAARVDPRARGAIETLALAIGERLPGDRVATLVGCVADRLTFEERLDDEIGARASGVRLQVWLLAIVVPALSLYLAVTVPSVGEQLRSPLGLGVLLPAALALEVGGILVSRHIVSNALR